MNLKCSSRLVCILLLNLVLVPLYPSDGLLQDQSCYQVFSRLPVGASPLSTMASAPTFENVDIRKPYARFLVLQEVR